MNAKQFAAALAMLDLNHTRAAAVLGIGRSSVLRYLAGQPVPANTERLLTMLIRHGIPEEFANG